MGALGGIVELPADLDKLESIGVLQAARVVQADRIMQEWLAEGHGGVWDQGENTWHTDPNWIAYFSLEIGLSEQAYDVAELIANPTLRRACNRIGDKYLIG